MMVKHHKASDELDIPTLARRKIEIFGPDAHPLMLARAENFRRRGHVTTAKFWLAVADAVAAMSKQAPNR
jgi:hypothetical protein